MIDFDYILSKIGTMGTYQMLMLGMVFYSGIPSGLNSLAPVFMSYQPAYRCAAPPFEITKEDGDNFTEIHSWTAPVDDEGNLDNCSRYNYNQSECVSGSYACLEGVNDTVSCLDADGYYYDTSLFTETVVTEMDLVCEKVIFSYIATSIYMLGLLIGSVLFGFISDRMGRKPTLVISSIGCAVGMVGAGLSHIYWLYSLFRLIIAFFGYGLTISCFVSVMEITGPQWRTLVGISFQAFFAIGYMTLSGVAYGLRDWHNMQWACVLISLPFGLFLFFIPESPRWLFSVGRENRARKITETIAKVNKVPITDEMWETARRLGTEKAEKYQTEKVETRRYGFKDLFSQPRMRRTTYKVMFNWFVNSLVYYGLSLNVGSLSGNIFINNVIGGCMEIASYIICILTMDRTGRKVLLCIMLLVSGISLLISTIFSEVANGDEALITAGVAFAFLGKMGISGSFAIIYNFTSELFPTVVRSNAIGIGSAAARIGGILTPFVIATQLLVTWLPNTIFGAFGILAGLLALTLPETGGIEMLETLEQAELFYAGQEMNTEVDKTSRRSSTNKENHAEFENKFYEIDLSTEL